MRRSGKQTIRTIAVFFALTVICLSNSVVADDIDVYRINIGSENSNILFVLDYSGSMSSSMGRPSRYGSRRLEVLKNVLDELLENYTGAINAGLGSLYNHYTTGIAWPVTDLAIDASMIDPSITPGTKTAKDVIIDRVRSRNAGGATATLDALVEAAQYFRGDRVTHTDAALNSSSSHQPITWNTTTESYSQGNGSAAVTYSPFHAWGTNTGEVLQCNDFRDSGGPNYCPSAVRNCRAIKASDPITVGYERLNNLWGDYQRCEYNRRYRFETPRYNSPLTSRSSVVSQCKAPINAIVLLSDGRPNGGSYNTSLQNLIGMPRSGCQALRAGGTCSVEVARVMANTPTIPALPKSRVLTYTIGFNMDAIGREYMQQIAQAGGGETFTPDSAEELMDAFTKIIDHVTEGGRSFSSPAVQVDTTNLAHKDKVYYSLFAPSRKRAWTGNVKGYFMRPEGLVDIHGKAATADGKFLTKSQSFWSSKADGGDVELGGASEQIIEGNRTLYTFTNEDLPRGGLSFVGNPALRLHPDNTAVNTALMGLTGAANASAQRNAALSWLQTAPMGDPLHTKSVSVTYSNREVVYIMTNQGLIHAIDATQPTDTNGNAAGGKEIFAFMPRRLLRNLPNLYSNTYGEGHIYGLDGNITRSHDDTNNDGIVNNNEKVTLYFGMRRGGSAYYALDVTRPFAPILKWYIDENTPGFEQLAQSWSTMSLVRVKRGSISQRVLAFGGGFDGAQDDTDTPVQSRGNAIYMVDEDGTLVWRADSSHHASMQYGIPSDLALIDTNNDQHADRLYVGDMAGQIWRVDFEDIRRSPNVTLLATLGDSDHQPVFYPPSVSLNENTDGRYLAIAVGSGNRTDPLNKEVQNHLYMIRDTDVETGPPGRSFRTAGFSDLYDASDDLVSSDNRATASRAQQAMNDARGWRVKLPDAEKSLSSLFAYQGNLMATTFSPEGQLTSDGCAYTYGGNLYALTINDASAAKQILTDPDRPSVSVRKTKVDNPGIPSSPVLVFSSATNTAEIFVDKKSIVSFDRRLSRVYWHAQ